MSSALENLERAIKNPMYNYSHHNALKALEVLRERCNTPFTLQQLENHIAVLKGCNHFQAYENVIQVKIPEFIAICKSAKVFVETAFKWGSMS